MSDSLESMKSAARAILSTGSAAASVETFGSLDVLGSVEFIEDFLS